MEKIKQIRTGEIIRINSEDYIICNTPHKNGTIEWEQPTLIKLKTIITNTNRKNYYRRLGYENPPLKKMIKGFKGIKLTINTRGENKK